MAMELAQMQKNTHCLQCRDTHSLAQMHICTLTGSNEEKHVHCIHCRDTLSDG